MHGLSNDFIYINCFEEKIEEPSKLAQVVSDRHKGIGSDGLILICPSRKADVRMQLFNADGSEAETSGNGIRCLAKYSYEHKLAKPGPEFEVPGQQVFAASLRIETVKGIVTVGLQTDSNDKVQQVCVNMGEPILRASDIPVKLKRERIIDEHITVLGHKLLMTCVSMGNPHAVFFCDDVGLIELEKLGPAIENHELFPNRINVHFVQVDKKNEFTMRTWERGCGITLACGSGACASLVAAVLTNQCNRISTGHLQGGDLQLNWSEKDNCVYMTGPAVEVFEGRIL